MKVELIDKMGTDLSVVNAARVSYSKTKDVFDEKDDTFGVGVYKTQSKKYLVISSYSTLTTEYQILDANTPDGSFKVFQARTRGLEYSISHYGDYFYVLSNADDAQNFKLSKTTEKHTEKRFWKDVIPHRSDVLLEGIDIFKDYLVVSERKNGLNQIKIILACEKAFNVHLKHREISAMENIGDMVDHLHTLLSN